jgi:hypothetical protein
MGRIAGLSTITASKVQLEDYIRLLSFTGYELQLQAWLHVDTQSHTLGVTYAGAERRQTKLPP